jgi:hypothetical protein
VASHTGDSTVDCLREFDTTSHCAWLLTRGTARHVHAVNAGSTQGHRRVNAGSTQGQRRVNAGSTQGQRRVNAGSTQGQPAPSLPPPRRKEPLVVVDVPEEGEVHAIAMEERLGVGRRRRGVVG